MWKEARWDNQVREYGPSLSPTHWSLLDSILSCPLTSTLLAQQFAKVNQQKNHSAELCPFSVIQDECWDALLAGNREAISSLSTAQPVNSHSHPIISCHTITCSQTERRGKGEDMEFRNPPLQTPSSQTSMVTVCFWLTPF